jgi:hypothetical protein
MGSPRWEDCYSINHLYNGLLGCIRLGPWQSKLRNPNTERPLESRKMNNVSSEYLVTVLV